MTQEDRNTCETCTSAERATTRGMEMFLWCRSGHAARRHAITTIEAVYLNPKHATCAAGYKRRTTPLPDVVTQVDPEPTIESSVAQPEEAVGNGLFDAWDETIPPWDYPEARFEPVSSGSTERSRR